MSSLGQLLDQLVARVSALENKVGGVPVVASAVSAPASSPASSSDEVSPLVTAFDEIVAKYGAEFKAVCDKIGGDAATLGSIVHSLYSFDRRVVEMSTKCKKPDQATKDKLVKEIGEIIAPLKALKDKRDQQFPNHVTAVIEGVVAFNWVLVEPAPLSVIELGRDGAEFYSNKVRKDSKDKNIPEWMSFANLFRDGFNAMYAFVKENCKTGLTYNPKGADASSFAGSAAAPAAAAPAAAPAAAAPAGTPTSAAKDAAALQSQLFAQLQSIDQSSGRTAGLRHVTKDMKSTGATAPVPAVTPAAPKAAAPAARPGDRFPTGEATCVLVDNRWKVDFQCDNQKNPLHMTDLTLKQEIYIFACKNAVIFIDAKCKGVRLDTCQNVTVVMDSILSGVEVVNSKKIKLQCNKSLPSVAIDKTDGILVGLAWASRHAQIVASKSSEMNVTFPVSEAEDADWIEQPIPEQFVTVINADNKLTTKVSDLYSA